MHIAPSTVVLTVKSALPRYSKLCIQARRSRRRAQTC